MRTIRKLPEPDSLTHYRASAGATYKNCPKQDIRAQLIVEQRGICCFCCQRIVDDPLKTKIAHWLPQNPSIAHQSDDRNELAYWNMLGACLGNQGQPPAKQHCDTHQGNRRLSKNPADSDHRIDEIISFPADGSITSSDPVFDRELGQKKPDGTFDAGVLNLNLTTLRNNRKAALDAFKRLLIKRGYLDGKQSLKELAKWDGSQTGELPPYAPVIAFWLMKRIARG